MRVAPSVAVGFPEDDRFVLFPGQQRFETGARKEEHGWASNFGGNPVRQHRNLEMVIGSATLTSLPHLDDSSRLGIDQALRADSGTKVNDVHTQLLGYSGGDGGCHCRVLQDLSLDLVRKIVKRAAMEILTEFHHVRPNPLSELFHRAAELTVLTDQVAHAGGQGTQSLRQQFDLESHQPARIRVGEADDHGVGTGARLDPQQVGEIGVHELP